MLLTYRGSTGAKYKESVEYKCKLTDERISILVAAHAQNATALPRYWSLSDSL